MFEPGQRVICIDGNFHPEIAFLFTGGLPREGQAYTVRECTLGRAKWMDGARGWASASWLVTLREITSPDDPSTNPPAELGFAAHRFRTPEQLETQAAEALTTPACVA